jgi:hypothetical protein
LLAHLTIEGDRLLTKLLWVSDIAVDNLLKRVPACLSGPQVFGDFLFEFFRGDYQLAAHCVLGLKNLLPDERAA